MPSITWKEYVRIKTLRDDYECHCPHRLTNSVECGDCINNYCNSFDDECSPHVCDCSKRVRNHSIDEYGLK